MNAPKRPGRPKLELTPAERQTRRRAQIAEASVTLRERRKAAGAVVIRFVLTGDDAATFTRLQEAQRGPIADFPRRALLCGAKFLANSGHPAGQKPGKSSKQSRGE